MPSLNWAEIETKLIQLGETLEQPVTLVVIGAAVGMSAGQLGRMTAGIDILRSSSQLDFHALKKACASIGIDFDPKGDDEMKGLHLQIIDEGIAQIGIYEETIDLMTVGNLRVSRPPIENIIASKMVRANASDFEDAVFLLKKYAVEGQTIEAVMKTFKNKGAIEVALDNLYFLLSCFDKG
jgi:hypothetical protein